jgi:hypothetical protein
MAAAARGFRIRPVGAADLEAVTALLAVLVGSAP